MKGGKLPPLQPPFSFQRADDPVRWMAWATPWMAPVAISSRRAASAAPSHPSPEASSIMRKVKGVGRDVPASTGCGSFPSWAVLFRAAWAAAHAVRYCLSEVIDSPLSRAGEEVVAA